MKADPTADLEASRVLLENRHLLPPQGVALDLACGLGGNALLLAEHGLRTYAWDYSAEAIEKLTALAAARGVRVHAETRDVIAAPPQAGRFDVIVVSRFLHRPLAGALSAALRGGGLLFYQTFTAIKASPGGPKNPDYLLKDNELLSMFAALKVRVYREENCLGDIRRGFRNSALLVAEREPRA